MFAFSAVNLGCSKNLVDLEFAIGEILKWSDRAPVEYISDPEDPNAEYVIVNTCGFLSSARRESEETLAYYDSLGKKLVLMGCYVSVKDDTFLSSLKNLKAVIPFISYSTIEELVTGKKSKFNLGAIARARKAAHESKEAKLTEYLESIQAPGKWNKAFVWTGNEVRAYIHAPFGYEYLKIAEGCDNNCTFCIIPNIRGRQNSRKIPEVLAEVKTMLANGIREVQILAQDTTRYGTDINDGKSLLLDLLEEIDQLEWDFKFRVYYLYPDTLTLEHLDRLAKLKKFLPYFDIPFQHASEHVLKLMGRHYDRAHIDEMLSSIRTKFSHSFIRTSFIVGFPGEWDEDFEILKTFVERERFESVGIFEYHDEPLAASSKLPNKVDDETTRKRSKEIGVILERIYAEQREARKGQESQGYIMELRKKTAIIRREIAAPEVDEYDEIEYKLIDSIQDQLEIGSFVRYHQPS
jgi:ribosomal protein S12 methylthiotransferase